MIGLARARLAAAIFNDTSGHRHHGCELVMRQLRSALKDQAIDCVWTEPRGEYTLDEAEHALRSMAPNVIVVNGEGTIHHTADRPRPGYLCTIGNFARKLGIPSVLLNATLQGIDAASLEELKAFDAIYVRETASRDVLRRSGINALVAPDLVFSYSYKGTERRSGVLGIDSVRPEISAAIEAHCNDMHWSYRRIKATKFGAGVVETIDEFCDQLSSTSLVITGRFHAVALCILTGTPFVAVESNTHKISAVLRDVFGNEDRLMAPGAISIVRDEDFMPWTTMELRSIAAFLTGARTGVDRMIEETERLARRDR